MRWSKQGLVYCPDGKSWWAKTHAAMPTPLLMKNGTIRVFFASRDENNVSRVGYVDVDQDNPGEILGFCEEPVLDIGTPGAFDDSGVLPTIAIDLGSEVRLYYFAFQLGVKVRYLIFTGLAVSSDGGISFQRYSNVPIMDRTDEDLFVRTGTSIVIDDGLWKMWYVGGNEWVKAGEKSVPKYRIKYTESPDGIKWTDEGRLCIDLKDEDEFGLGRPFVIHKGTHYEMYFSYRARTSPYRIGFAVSEDGLSWERRDDEAEIRPSERGWDEREVCFASVINSRGRTYMFYNGYNFGESGFGYAVLQDS